MLKALLSDFSMAQLYLPLGGEILERGKQEIVIQLKINIPPEILNQRLLFPKNPFAGKLDAGSFRLEIKI